MAASRCGGRLGRAASFRQRGGDLVAAAVDVDFLPELVDQPRVGQRPVAATGGEAVAGDQRVEVVAVVLRVEQARELDGAQHRRAKDDAEALELVLQEAIVETRVVGDEQAAFQPAQDLAGERRERRRVGDHRVADAGQLLDEGRDAGFRIDQLLPFADRAVGSDGDDADLGDAVGGRRGAGGFEVDEGKRAHGRDSLTSALTLNGGTVCAKVRIALPSPPAGDGQGALSPYPDPITELSEHKSWPDSKIIATSTRT